MTELYSKYLDCGGRVATDSRRISGGELFFALKGENYDGNDYALRALENGAAFAVVSSDSAVAASVPSDAASGDSRLIVVEDTLAALTALAIEHRETLGIPVIGLTGTNGKTTTKNLIAEVLSRKYRVCATEGNLNNDVGVPLSLLKMNQDTQIAVIEMGANHPDDIAKLVKVSRPDYGLVTNVGMAHLLGFGSFEGVKAAKGELYRWLADRQGSVIFLNADDADLREMSAGLPCHFFEYGIDYQGVEIIAPDSSEPFLRMKLDGRTINTGLVGSYNASNVLAAICVGDYFGVSRKESIAAVESFNPDNSRSQMSRTERNSVIVDAYNANPTSMSVALDNFASIRAERKLALLGDMRELGESSLDEHRRIVRKLGDLGLQACLVGEEFRKAVNAEGSGNITAGAEQFLLFDSSEELANWLSDKRISGMFILVKGSRGIRMEKVLGML